MARASPLNSTQTFTNLAFEDSEQDPNEYIECSYEEISTAIDTELQRQYQPVIDQINKKNTRIARRPHSLPLLRPYTPLINLNRIPETPSVERKSFDSNVASFRTPDCYFKIQNRISIVSEEDLPRDIRIMEMTDMKPIQVNDVQDSLHKQRVLSRSVVEAEEERSYKRKRMILIGLIIAAVLIGMLIVITLAVALTANQTKKLIDTVGKKDQQHQAPVMTTTDFVDFLHTLQKGPVKIDGKLVTFPSIDDSKEEEEEKKEERIDDEEGAGDGQITFQVTLECCPTTKVSSTTLQSILETRASIQTTLELLREINVDYSSTSPVSRQEEILESTTLISSSSPVSQEKIKVEETEQQSSSIRQFSTRPVADVSTALSTVIVDSDVTIMPTEIAVDSSITSVPTELNRMITVNSTLVEVNITALEENPVIDISCNRPGQLFYDTCKWLGWATMPYEYIVVGDHKMKLINTDYMRMHEARYNASLIATTTTTVPAPAGDDYDDEYYTW